MNAVAELPREVLALPDPIAGAMHIPLLALEPSRTNPRKHFAADDLQDLARSIQAHGLLQPILVRPVGRLPPGARRR